MASILTEAGKQNKQYHRKNYVKISGFWDRKVSQNCKWRCSNWLRSKVFNNSETDFISLFPRAILKNNLSLLEKKCAGDESETSCITFEAVIQWILNKLLVIFNEPVSSKTINIELFSAVKDILKAFNDFKNKQKSVWSNAFWYVRSMYILEMYSIHYTRRQNTNAKKISFGQNEACSLFSFQAPIHHSFMCWSTRFISLKLCEGFSIFDSVSFLLKFIFLFKVYIFYFLKHHNSFQN